MRRAAAEERGGGGGRLSGAELLAPDLAERESFAFLNSCPGPCPCRLRCLCRGPDGLCRCALPVLREEVTARGRGLAEGRAKLDRLGDMIEERFRCGASHTRSDRLRGRGRHRHRQRHRHSESDSNAETEAERRPRLHCGGARGLSAARLRCRFFFRRVEAISTFQGLPQAHAHLGKHLQATQDW